MPPQTMLTHSGGNSGHEGNSIGGGHLRWSMKKSALRLASHSPSSSSVVSAAIIRRRRASTRACSAQYALSKRRRSLSVVSSKNKSDSERLSPLRSNFRCSVKAEPDRGIMRISDPPRCVINRKFVRLPWSRFTKDGFVNDELFVGAEWCERGG